ncbi:hypothetical protein [Streptomyces sp. NPDC096193]|uniref:hypothetical protein n=1 Tax=Streptomyces sp. NPDC096193 TaxID=3155821 RepID=UPI0033305141
MLALRLARGSHPLALLRRLLVAAASAGVGFLLLCTLSYALAHPGSAASVARLTWCVIPLAATVHFAVAVARADPSTRPRPGLSAIGLGPGRLAALAAVSTAMSGALGSMVALLFFLHLRGDLTGLPFDGAASELLAADRPLPLAAMLMLLAIAPLSATAATALTLRPRRTPSGLDPEPVEEPKGPPGGLPWGCALTTAGLAIETYTARTSPGSSFPLAGSFESNPVGVLAGWTLTALGLALAGPAITHFCGRLLQMLRPGAIRLLAGRTLMDEARGIGRPLGVVSAVASAVITASTLYDTGPRPFGPLTGLGAALVIACTTATLLTSVAESRHARAITTANLRKLGTPAAMLRAAAGLRLAALLVVFGPLTWIVATLAAIPLSG